MSKGTNFQLQLRRIPVLFKRHRTAVKDCFQRGMRKAGQYWHDNYLPIHFTRAGYRRYINPVSICNYRPNYTEYFKRQGERGTHYTDYFQTYTGKKLQKYGHTNPLVLTGKSRETAMNNYTFKGVNRQGGERVEVNLIMDASNIGNAPNKRTMDTGAAINYAEQMKEEMTAVIREEYDVMFDICKAEVLVALREFLEKV